MSNNILIFWHYTMWLAAQISFFLNVIRHVLKRYPNKVGNIWKVINCNKHDKYKQQ